jgi:hypothetical protein
VGALEAADGQADVVEPVIERRAGHGDAEPARVGEVRQPGPPGLVALAAPAGFETFRPVFGGGAGDDAAPASRLGGARAGQAGRRAVEIRPGQPAKARPRGGLIQRADTAREVWAASARRAAEAEARLAEQACGAASTRQAPRGRPMPRPTRRVPALRAAPCARVEPVLAHRKARMGPAIRTVGPARARAAVTLATMAHTMTRRRRRQGRPAPD